MIVYFFWNPFELFGNINFDFRLLIALLGALTIQFLALGRDFLMIPFKYIFLY